MNSESSSIQEPKAKKPEFSPEDLFKAFRKLNMHGRYQTLQRFGELSKEERMTFLEPTLEFLKTERDDSIRCWVASTLQLIGGEKAFDALVELIEKANVDEKSDYRFTRFYALRGIEQIALSENKLPRLLGICEAIVKDKDEGARLRLAAKVILSKHGKKPQRRTYEEELRKHLEDVKGYFRLVTVLTVLREFPSSAFCDELIEITRNKKAVPEVRYRAIEALGSLGSDADIEIVRGLGEVAISETADRYLRLQAVKSLLKLRNPVAQRDLLHALEKDEDAEIKVQATHALVELLGKSEAVSVIVQEALGKGLKDSFRENLEEALRRIDKDRTVASQILGKELGGDDEERVRTAEKILISLGGWAALRNISQRRSTLNSTDRLLSESERVVQETHEKTMYQARLNFYFAMGVNISIVIVGIVLIGIAVSQLIQQPGKLESWLVPGGAGLIGVILDIGFNNPRNNAKQDLRTLLNVNILFLGFLRQLSEIDATFKHAYLEKKDFSIEDMQKTVNQIADAVKQTLAQGSRYLQTSEKELAKVATQPEVKSATGKNP